MFSFHLWTLKRRVSLIPVNTSYIVPLPLESFSNGTINLSSSFFSGAGFVCFIVLIGVKKRFYKFTLLLCCVASKLHLISVTQLISS